MAAQRAFSSAEVTHTHTPTHTHTHTMDMDMDNKCSYFLRSFKRIEKEIQNLHDENCVRRDNIIETHTGEEEELMAQLKREEETFVFKKQILEQDLKTCHEMWTSAFKK